MQHEHVAYLRAKYGSRGGAHGRHRELYPLVACVGVGFALFGLYNVWDLAENPDVNLRRRRRETPAWERFRPQETEFYTAHRAPLAQLHVNPINRAATSVEDENVWGEQRCQHE